MQLDSLAEAASHGMALAWHAAREPARDALIIGAKRLTFAELNASVNRLAHHLQEHLEVGESIAIVSRNRIEFVVGCFAALRTGLCITPISWHLTADEMAYIINDCAARVVRSPQQPSAARADTTCRITPGCCAPGRSTMQHRSRRTWPSRCTRARPWWSWNDSMPSRRWR